LRSVCKSLIFDSVGHPEKKNYNFISACSRHGCHFTFIAANNYCAHLVIPSLIVGNELATQWRHQPHRTICERPGGVGRGVHVTLIWLGPRNASINILTNTTRNSLSFVVVLNLISIMHMEAVFIGDCVISVLSCTWICLLLPSLALKKITVHCLVNYNFNMKDNLVIMRSLCYVMFVVMILGYLRTQNNFFQC
jgi:hypothetical protein